MFEKKLTLLLTFSFLIIVLCAQNRPKLGFIPYSNPDTESGEYRELAYDYLYEAAIRIFINTQRFDILDRSKFDIVKLEQNFTKGDDFINSEIVAQGNALAAEVLAVAKLTALNVQPIKDGAGWTSFFTVELKQIDVETTKAVNAIQLKGEINVDGTIKIGNTEIPSGGGAATSPEQAIDKVVQQMETILRDWINEAFPIKMEVLDHDATNKVIYVRGGRNIGLTTKDKMSLRRIRKLKTGDVVEETIVELKFTKEDGVGEATTKFHPLKGKEWTLIMQALRQYPDEIFVMESARRTGGFTFPLKK